jgi:hypothetical protein
MRLKKLVELASYKLMGGSSNESGDGREVRLRKRHHNKGSAGRENEMQ